MCRQGCFNISFQICQHKQHQQALWLLMKFLFCFLAQKHTSHEQMQLILMYEWSFNMNIDYGISEIMANESGILRMGTFQILSLEFLKTCFLKISPLNNKSFLYSNFFFNMKKSRNIFKIITLNIQTVFTTKNYLSFYHFLA